MAATISGTTLTFSDSTTMTTSRQYGYDGGVGTWADAIPTMTATTTYFAVGQNSTISGSNLAFGVTNASGDPVFTIISSSSSTFQSSGSGNYSYTTAGGSWRGRYSVYSYTDSSGYDPVTYYVWRGDIFQRYA